MTWNFGTLAFWISAFRSAWIGILIVLIRNFYCLNCEFFGLSIVYVSNGQMAIHRYFYIVGTYVVFNFSKYKQARRCEAGRDVYNEKITTLDFNQNKLRRPQIASFLNPTHTRSMWVYFDSGYFWPTSAVFTTSPALNIPTHTPSLLFLSPVNPFFSERKENKSYQIS